MEFTELLEKRRSTRAFTGEPVSAEALHMMLESGVQAPNACNAQCWHFFCTLDTTFIDSLIPSVYSNAWLRDAGCVILICTDPKQLEARFGAIARDLFSIQDTAAAATQILQCAANLGLSGCWIGAFRHDAARTAFQVPDEMEPVILLAIGHAATEVPKLTRKPLSDVVTMCGKETAEMPSEKPFQPSYILRCASIPDARFEDLNLQGAVFDNVNLAAAAFSNINLNTAAFSDINFNTTAFAEARMQDAAFDAIDLRGTVFSDCDLRGVTIENCKLDDMTINGYAITDLLKKKS